MSDADYTGFRADPCHFTKKAISYFIEARFNITYVVNFLMGMHRHATRSHCWLVRPPIDPYGRLAPPVSFKIDSQVDQYQLRMFPKEEQRKLTRRDIYDEQTRNMYTEHKKYESKANFELARKEWDHMLRIQRDPWIEIHDNIYIMQLQACEQYTFLRVCNK